MSNENNRLVLLPYRLTAENGAKALLSGVFYETITQTCPDCCANDPDADCEICDGEVTYEQKVMVSWSTIKEIWTAAADEFVLGEQQTDHAKSGKWRVCTQFPNRILQDDGRPVIATLGGGHEKQFTPEENYARARRVAAAWNACKSVATEDLERYYETGAGIDEALEEAGLQDHLKAVQQRDLLLAALSYLWTVFDGEEFTAEQVEAMEKARAAIIAAKGGVA
ncbi:hypothetical protein [Chromobacterium rhizoryzae]|uniref:hypothetical protein n=1 Tax=Chromobacterium rhizoryzae TaxID=1778675 RepID=UPI001D0660DF|nr:hypothetical protein [Chromobacterium rhizoryzae]